MNLPLESLNFLKWLIIDFPSKIFRVFRIILLHINNEFGFTLNLGLIFTPIYGDYTIPGRIIGFVFRFIQIISGIVFVVLAFIVMVIAPIIWYILPGLILYLQPILILLYVGGLFIFWKFITAETPKRSVSSSVNAHTLEAFRPKARSYLELIQKDFQEGLFQILEDPDIQNILSKSELELSILKNKLKESPIPETNSITDKSYEFALQHQSKFIESEQVFLAAISIIPKIDLILSTFGSSLKSLEGSAGWIVNEREKLNRIFIWQDDYPEPKIRGVGRTMTGRVTPFLDQISEDFTKNAIKGFNKRYVAHKDEMKKVAEILGGSKVNVLITGEPGSGKTSIVRNLSYEIVRGTGYNALKFKRIVNIQTGRLFAGAKNTGELAQKIKKAMEEVESSGDIILFIDEIHNVVSGVSNEDSENSSVFSILEPYLSSGRIQFIGATSVENYRKFIEPNGAFSRLFQIVEIPPSSKEETLEVIKVIAGEQEKEYGVYITFPALTNIINLSAKLIHERVFPDKAIDILIRTVSTSTKEDRKVTAEDVAKEIAGMTKIPIATITTDESDKLLKIEEELKKNVIGQDSAISQVAKALKRARMGIRNENKPIASFLFVGTTGVGKTETAKALAKTYFGDTKRMIRLDMSEYQQIDSLNKLIGAPDGKSKGILTEAVRSNPFSLILLDEIEKAYSSVLLAFLQVLDDGRLTDSTGKTIDFTNSIIIATSNVGTRGIQEIESTGGTFDQMEDSAMKDVRDKYAPEFLNRFNGIIVFKPLSQDSVKQICTLMLENVKKIADNKGIKLGFKPELVEKLITLGYSPQWGARPLARVIEDTVETYVATKMLSKEIKMGDEIELGLEVFEGN